MQNVWSIAPVEPFDHLTLVAHGKTHKGRPMVEVHLRATSAVVQSVTVPMIGFNKDDFLSFIEQVKVGTAFKMRDEDGLPAMFPSDELAAFVDGVCSYLGEVAADPTGSPIYDFAPLADITAFELALLVALPKATFKWLTVRGHSELPRGLQRHYTLRYRQAATKE